MFCENQRAGEELLSRGQVDLIDMHFSSSFFHFVLIDLFALFFIDFFYKLIERFGLYVVTINQLLRICDNFSCLLLYLYISK